MSISPEALDSEIADASDPLRLKSEGVLQAERRDEALECLNALCSANEKSRSKEVSPLRGMVRSNIQINVLCGFVVNPVSSCALRVRSWKSKRMSLRSVPSRLYRSFIVPSTGNRNFSPSSFPSASDYAKHQHWGAGSFHYRNCSIPDHRCFRGSSWGNDFCAHIGSGINRERLENCGIGEGKM
jgi:hypothetical protein